MARTERKELSENNFGFGPPQLHSRGDVVAEESHLLTAIEPHTKNSISPTILTVPARGDVAVWNKAGVERSLLMLPVGTLGLFCDIHVLPASWNIDT